MASRFKIFVGIDQTGAVAANGKPKPLPCTLIDAREILLDLAVKPNPLRNENSQRDSNNPGPIKIISGLKLNSLREKDLQSLISQHAPGSENEAVLVCVDSVLALPEALDVKFDEVLSKARDFSHAGKAYGALTAHAFFHHFLRLNSNSATAESETASSATLPRRKMEIELKANSVFNLKPFQRNVGCGSYRILKDLAQDPRWFSVWPFEPIEHRFVVAEGYPSFLWKKLFQLKSRNLDSLKALFPAQNFLNADDADSFVLAWGAQHFQAQIFDPAFAHLAHEGWILGYSRNEPLLSEG